MLQKITVSTVAQPSAQPIAPARPRPACSQTAPGMPTPRATRSLPHSLPRSQTAPGAVCQTRSHSTRFYSVHLPKGAVYTIIPQRIIKGRTMPKTYIWVDNLHLARTNQHFIVHTMTRYDDHPKAVYVDGNFGYAKALQDFIRNLPAENLETVPTITRKQIHATGAPRDRKVGAYTQRAVPSRGDNPKVMTQTSVTAGAHVGKNFLTSEGYAHNRMGVETPDMGDKDYLKPVAMPDYRVQAERTAAIIKAHREGK